MAFKTLNMKLFSLLISSFVIIQIAIAADPDILSDFIAPQNVTVDGNFFTFTGLRFLFNVDPPAAFNASEVSLAQFPALNGQSVSLAVLEFPPNSSSPVHARPGATGLLFLISGSLEVGFVDTTKKLFIQTLQVGDLFVFPKALVHFQFNPAMKEPALAIAAFGSANPRTVSLLKTLFSTGIDDSALALSFKTDIATIRRLKAGLASKS